MAHTCPDGIQTKLIRTGPVGTTNGVTFCCPRCGHTKSAAQIQADFVAAIPIIKAALS